MSIHKAHEISGNGQAIIMNALSSKTKSGGKEWDPSSTKNVDIIGQVSNLDSSLDRWNTSEQSTKTTELFNSREEGGIHCFFSMRHKFFGRASVFETPFAHQWKFKVHSIPLKRWDHNKLSNGFHLQLDLWLSSYTFSFSFFNILNWKLRSGL